MQTWCSSTKRQEAEEFRWHLEIPCFSSWYKTHAIIGINVSTITTSISTCATGILILLSADHHLDVPDPYRRDPRRQKQWWHVVTTAGIRPTLGVLLLGMAMAWFVQSFFLVCFGRFCTHFAWLNFLILKGIVLTWWFVILPIQWQPRISNYP